MFLRQTLLALYLQRLWNVGPHNFTSLKFFNLILRLALIVYINNLTAPLATPTFGCQVTMADYMPLWRTDLLFQFAWTWRIESRHFSIADVYQSHSVSLDAAAVGELRRPLSRSSTPVLLIISVD